MKYIVVFEHKVSGQHGIIDTFDTEDLALAAANDNAVRADFCFYVCPMQTKISGDVTISTTVMAQTVTSAAVDTTAVAASVTPATTPLNVSPTL